MSRFLHGNHLNIIIRAALIDPQGILLSLRMLYSIAKGLLDIPLIRTPTMAMDAPPTLGIPPSRPCTRGPSLKPGPIQADTGQHSLNSSGSLAPSQLMGHTLTMLTTSDLHILHPGRGLRHLHMNIRNLHIPVRQCILETRLQAPNLDPTPRTRASPNLLSTAPLLRSTTEQPLVEEV